MLNQALQPQKNKPNILLADDHDLLGDLLAYSVKRFAPEFNLVFGRSLPAGLELLKTANPLSLVLLDLNMPGMNGLTGLSTMIGATPQTPVALISGELTRKICDRAFELGAAGCIPKSLTAAQLWAAINLILSGQRYSPEKTLDEDMSVKAAGLPALSERETAVVELLVLGQSNKEMARVLKVKDCTIAAHLSSIYEKLGVANRTQATRAILQSGWRASAL